MAEYGDGEKGAVENESYCMPSWNARNTESMNKEMQYHNMSDLSNTPRPPTQMKAAHENKQVGPEKANPSKNDRKGKAY